MIKFKEILKESKNYEPPDIENIGNFVGDLYNITTSFKGFSDDKIFYHGTFSWEAIKKSKMLKAHKYEDNPDEPAVVWFIEEPERAKSFGDVILGVKFKDIKKYKYDYFVRGFYHILIVHHNIPINKIIGIKNAD